MFDLLDDVVGLATTVTKVAVDTVKEPVVDSLDLFDGLTEGEFREKAALRLGADVVGGMALSEIIDAMSE